MPSIIDFSPNRAFDLNGYSVRGALATFYDAGTTRLRTVYKDAECSIPHPSPLQADGAGVFPPVFDAGGDVRVIVTDAAGVTLAGYPLDPASVFETDVTGAGGIAFTPTVEIPEDNVQAAIERVQANLVAPLAGFGLGVTGNGPLLAALDASTTASGQYRYDATTSGTFPPGVTKADAGVVAIWRQAAHRFIQTLSPISGGRTWMRFYNAGWSTWRWYATSVDVADDAAWQSGASAAPVLASPASIKVAITSLTVGLGQTWRNPTRVANTTYQNTTGAPIQVILAMVTNSNATVKVGATAGTLITIFADGDWDRYPLSFIVPTGHFYRLETANAIHSWMELR